ncbi:hypothetical protein BS78_K233700 [Paspalum vaginatum]|uniref:Uncharacterized protein n=1 Tax=Paspalum vaginatum TaxID=158149 RepID=A0A9W8CF17_9POAL|nr:hypothetical protein BS78_K233700 [Paspalum vaginatum]
MREILQVYEENARLKQEFAAAQSSALREKNARLKEELAAAKASTAEKAELKSQVEVLIKQKDAVEAESSRLKGELANLKTSFEAKVLEDKAKYSKAIDALTEERSKALEELVMQRLCVMTQIS